MNLFVQLLVFLFFPKCLPCAKYHIVGNEDTTQFFKLKSEFEIIPGSSTDLYIDVPLENLGLNGMLPPKLVSIYSSTSDGVYGVGDSIILKLEYSSVVKITGIPTLTVNTGCHSAKCVQKEIQTFLCKAEVGAFAVQVDNKYVMTINANSTQEVLKYKLQEVPEIIDVTVKFSHSGITSTVYDNVCTSMGNLITITFEDVYFPMYDGNVPELVFNDLNDIKSPFSGLSLGNIEHRLKGHQHSFPVYLTPVATEVQSGKKQRDGVAYYINGSGTSVLEFAYVVRNGDYASQLDVVAINFDDGFIYDPRTGLNTSSNVPLPGGYRRYMNSAATSLSYNANITITSNVPRVTGVISIENDGTYTQGDAINICVIFDLPIKYYGESIFLLLQPGKLFRKAFVNQLIEDHKLCFLYEVGNDDYSLDLEYYSETSMDLNGGKIYLKSASNLSEANCSLPIPGQPGSLSASSNIVIDTTSPIALDFSIISEPGNYTAGDSIDIRLIYNLPVHVVGKPSIWVRNEPQTFGNARVMTAPAYQMVSNNSNIDDTIEIFNSDNRTIILYPGHELKQFDLGCTIEIGGSYYVIKNIQENLLTLSDDYVGPIIRFGIPENWLFTPDSRPAYFLNGSDSTQLVFRYDIQRDDYMKGLTIHNFNSSNLVKVPFDLFPGDRLLRFSLYPSLNVDLKLPILSNGNIVTVDSIQPFVVKITTTMSFGTFVAGDFFDILITFSHSVMIDADVDGSPVFLFRKKSGDIGIARYYSGSGTSTLTFLYEISDSDVEISDFSTNALMQPLRVIVGNEFNYICRSAKIPVVRSLLDVNNAIVSIPEDLNWIGSAPAIVKIMIVNTDSKVFSAGDKIQLEVVYSKPVKIINSSLTLLLNVGKPSNQPGIALFEQERLDNRTIRFSYEVQIEDNCSFVSLFPFYFGQLRNVMIHANNGTQILDDSIHTYKASLIIMQNPSDDELILHPIISIDNSQPKVHNIFSNVTSGVYTPGVSILISLNFSSNISVIGQSKLLLQGFNGFCPGYYYSGNNSNIISYVYMPGSYSRTAAVSCSSILAGENYTGLFKYSNNPRIPVNVSLPQYGDVSSLGIFSKIIIDNSPAVLVSVDVPRPVILATDTLNFYILNQTRFVYLPFRYWQEDEGNELLFYDSLDILREKFKRNRLPIDIGQTYSSLTQRDLVGTFSHMTIAQLSDIVIVDEKFISLQSPFWFSKYYLSDKVEIVLGFSQKVVEKYSFLELNVGRNLNRAFAQRVSNDWLVNIKLESTIATISTFKLQYGPWDTDCISVSASLDGTMSLYAKLAAIKEFHKLGFRVKIESQSASQIVFSIATRTPPKYPLTVSSRHNLCQYPVDLSKINVTTDGKLRYSYDIKIDNSIILKSKESTGLNKFKSSVHGDKNPIIIKRWGIGQNSFILTHYNRYGRQVSKSIVESTKILPRISYSSIIFSELGAREPTSVSLLICAEIVLLDGDSFRVTLPKFHSIEQTLYRKYENYSVGWNSAVEVLQINISAATNHFCNKFYVENDFGLQLPQSSFLDASLYTFSLISDRVYPNLMTFSDVHGFAIDSANISLSCPVFGEVTTISVMFRLNAYLTAESEIKIYIPGVQIPIGRRHDEMGNSTSLVKLIVSDSYAFVAGILVSNSTIYFIPKFDLLPGYYEISLLKENEIIIANPEKLADYSPPLLSIQSQLWNSSWTNFTHFTTIIGVNETDLQIHLDTHNNRILALRLTISFLTEIREKLNITFIIPRLNYFGCFIQLRPDLSWNESSKELFWTIIPVKDTTVQLYIDTFNLKGFNYPFSKNENDNYAKLAIKSINYWLPNIPILEVSKYPSLVAYFSIKSGDDILRISASSMHFSVFTTLPLRLGDKFTIYFIGTKIDYTFSNKQKVQVSENSKKYLIHMDEVNNTIELSIIQFNNSNYQMRSLNFSIPSDFGITFLRPCLQYRSPTNIFIEWTRENDFSIKQEVLTNVYFPFLWSSLAYSSPNAGERSDLFFKFMLTSHLSPIHSIVIRLIGHQFSWVEKTLVDLNNNTWSAKVDPDRNQLHLSPLQEMSPSAIEIVFDLEYRHLIPSSTSNSTITVCEYDVCLLESPISSVAATGSISNSSYFALSSKESKWNLSFYVQTGNPLNHGDTITIYFSDNPILYDDFLRFDCLFCQTIYASRDTNTITLEINNITTIVTGRITLSGCFNYSENFGGVYSNNSLLVSITSMSNPALFIPISFQVLPIFHLSTIQVLGRGYLERHSLLPDNLTYLFISFSTDAIIVNKTVIEIYFPQFSSEHFSNTDLLILDSDTYLQDNTLKGTWNESSKTISINCLQEKSFISVVVAANLNVTAVYANDSKIQYTLSFLNARNGPLYFTKVIPYLLQSSSFGITFEESCLYLMVTMATGFDLHFNDSVVIDLPGFQGLSNVVYNTELNSCDSVSSISFENSTSTLVIDFFNNCKVLNLSFPFPSGNLILPKGGFNEYINKPTLRVSCNDSVYSNIDFQTISYVVGLYDATVELAEGSYCGLESDIVIAYFHDSPFMPGDLIEITLGQFWGTKRVVSVNHNGSFWAAAWNECEEKLAVVIPEYIPTGRMEITIHGLRSPLGSNYVETSLVSLDGWSIFGKVYNLDVMKVPNLNCFSNFSISFSGNNISNEHAILINLAPASSWKLYSQIDIFLPGFVSSEAYLLNTYDAGSLLQLNNYIVAKWTESNSTLSIRLVNDTVLNIESSLLIGESKTTGFVLPSTGVNENVVQKISTTVSDQTVRRRIPLDVQYVGIIHVVVNYDIVALSNPISLWISIKISKNFSPGDTFYVEAPCLQGETAELIFDSSSPFLSVHFNSTSHIIELSIYDYLQTNTLDIYFSEINRLKISSLVGTQNVTHYISGYISGIGFLSKFPIDYTPDNVVPLIVDNLNISCSTNYINCTLGFDLNILGQIYEGEYISLSHSSLDRVLSHSTSNEADLLESSAFSVVWRGLDISDSIQLTSKSLSFYHSEGDVVVDSDFDYHEVDLNFTSFSLPSITVLLSLPRIVRVYARVSYTNLIFGDLLRVYVVFSHPVQIHSTVDLRRASDIIIKLIPDLSCVFSNGNNTDTLEFTCHVTVKTQTEQLSLSGPNSLQYTNCEITLVNKPTVLANLTIPPPYDLFNLDSHRKITLNIPGSAVIEAIDLCELNLEYYFGDFVDLCILYSRSVEVFGSPYILLNGIGNNTIRFNFVATYSIQWINVSMNGYYKLSYYNQSTSCIFWNDFLNLKTQIEQINELDISLPLSIYPFPTSRGFEIQLKFSGLSPGALKIDPLACLPYYSASLYLPKLQTLVFRHQLNESENLSNNTTLSYTQRAQIELDAFSSIWVYTHIARVNHASLILPLNKSLNALIITQRPRVIHVWSNFSGIAGCGDTIHIFVVFDYPVVVTSGIPFLELEISSGMKQASLLENSFGNYLTFTYVVKQHDFAQPLNFISSESLVLNGSQVLAKSKFPSMPANLTLPTIPINSTLAGSNVTIMTHFPLRTKIVSVNKEPGVYGAGEEIVLTLSFSSFIFLISNDDASSTVPYLKLNSGNESKAIYFEGNGTQHLSFLYVVQPGENSVNLTFDNSIEYCFRLYNFVFFDGVSVYWDREVFCDYQNELQKIAVNTEMPIVIRVYSHTANGNYYSGDSIDISIEFSQPITILAKVRTALPQLQLYLPNQNLINSLAQYYYGNNTNIIRFLYIVPLPAVSRNRISIVQLDYAGANALQNFQNGNLFYRSSTAPTTIANTFLPSSDKSFVKYFQDIKMIFQSPSVLNVVALNDSGVYSAGDVLLFAVNFDQPVMVIYPIHLRLETGQYDRNANYESGNLSTTLIFKYSIEVSDFSTILDYIDTRLSPYDFKGYRESFPLNLNDNRLGADLSQSFRENNINIYPFDTLVGIFKATTSSLIPVFTGLPFPGDEGSISSSKHIQIDTKSPNVTSVFTNIPDGTYSVGVTIPIYVTFTSKVSVYGHPMITIHVSGKDKYAEFVEVENNCDDTVVFQYIVDSFDELPYFDYKDRYSLGFPKHITIDNASVILFEGKIVRCSSSPLIIVNYTLPWVNYVESVISPKSIRGNGHSISISSLRNAVSVYSSGRLKLLSLGDVLDLYVVFSCNVKVISRSLYISLNTNSSAYFVGIINDRILRFQLLIEPHTEILGVQYQSIFSLRSTSSCPILSQNTNSCIPQNLPKLFSEGDLLSSNRIEINNHASKIRSISFANHYNRSVYTSGEIFNVVVAFNTDIKVLGYPYLVLHDQWGLEFEMKFSKNINSSAIIFSKVLDLTVDNVIINCSLSYIKLNGGAIVKNFNFLPLSIAELNFQKICQEESFKGVFVRSIPFVKRVYANANGTFSFLDNLNLFIEFSDSVVVFGEWKLKLNLEGEKSATYIGMASVTTMQFVYFVGNDDSTAALDYMNTFSLTPVENHCDVGIFKSSAAFRIPVNVTLPEHGTAGSLGRQNDIIMDPKRPNIIDVDASPFLSTAGQIVTISLKFSSKVKIIAKTVPISFQDLFLELGIAVSNGYLIEKRIAYFAEISENILKFKYLIEKTDSSGNLVLLNQSPIINGALKIVDFENGVLSSPLISMQLVNKTLSIINNEIPYVRKVTSNSVTTEYPLGVGDVVNIVIHMSKSVAVMTVPTLNLLLADGRSVVAQFSGDLVPVDGLVKNFGGCYEDLTFEYEIQEGDVASPLEYSGLSALQGDIRLCVSEARPSIFADLTLPFPFSIGSIAYCCPTYIDTIAPYVKYLIPLKMPGIYGNKEFIAILARFSKPVVIVGVPLLELQTSHTTVGCATFYKSFDEFDLLIDILETDVIFIYQVKESDNIESLTHSSARSIILNNGSRILHKTTNPTTDADILLRSPNDFELTNGKIERQWMINYPQKVELVVRDFYHSDPSQITIKLEHGSNEVVLVKNSSNSGTFGSSLKYAKLGNNHQVFDVDSNIGTDLFFSDSRAENIAMKGAANQSSTAFDGVAERAIDGSTSQLYSDKSCSQTTDADHDPWWQVHLPLDSVVRSIQIWQRLFEEWIPAVILVTIKAFDNYPEGMFKLEFAHVDNSALTYTTEYIQFGASAIDVTNKINRIATLAQVQVERDTVTGIGTEKGFGWVYRITFFGVKTTEPSINITETKFSGGVDIIDSVSIENYRKYRLVIESKLRNVGRAIALNSDINNSWIFPFWLFIFQENGQQPPVSLNESQKVAIWFKKYHDIPKENLLQVVLDVPLTNVGYVKIQREGQKPLSLAEVEVYSSKLNSLTFYDDGFPVKPSSVLKPYQPIGSFQNSFQFTKFYGRWTLQIISAQLNNYSPPFNIRGWKGSYGSISDWILIVTDLSGVVKVFYQDIRSIITSTPKYGSLYYSSGIESNSFGDWKDSFELKQSSPILSAKGFELSRGFCYGSDSSGLYAATSAVEGYKNCPLSFGVGPLLSNQKYGDVPGVNFIRGERMLFYVPRKGYLGPDFFTYKIKRGPDEQSSLESEVTIHIRKCRVADYREFDSMCECRPAINSQVSSWNDCKMAVIETCSREESSNEFFNLCLACASTATLNTSATFLQVSSDCRSEILRAQSYLVLNARCARSPVYNCEDETITEKGKESRNYLSLKSYTLGYPFTLRRAYTGDW